MGDQVGTGVAYTCTKNVYKFRVISRDMNSKAAKNNEEKSCPLDGCLRAEGGGRLEFCSRHPWGAWPSFWCWILMVVISSVFSI